MMDSWIWQPGYPLVTASLDGDELVLRQQRFAFDERTLDEDVAPTTWLVPVHVRAGEQDEVVLLDGDEARVSARRPGRAGRRQRRRARLLPRRLRRRAARPHLR